MPLHLNLPSSLRFARFMGVAVFAFVLITLEWRQRELWYSAESLQHAETTLAASELRARVDRELNAVFNLTLSLASYLEVKRGRVDDAELNALLQQIYAKTDHLRNFGVAVDYRLKYIYPLAGNESALGLDYRTLSQQWPDIERAIERRSSVLAGPVVLAQGGSALIYRAPVFVDDQYWGMASAVIDAPALFKAVGTSRLPYAIRTSDAGHTIIWGDASLFNDPRSSIIASPVPGGEWQYAVPPSTVVPIWWERLLFDLVAVAVSVLLGYFSYATQRHRHVLYNVSRIDPITKLLNRRALENSLELILERRRKSDQHCALLFIDLDRFKYINDTHGHRAGDGVLSMVAERLSKELRAADVIGRWGGDELVVLVEEGDSQVLENLIVRLRRAINLPVMFGNDELHVGASIGCATFPNDGVTLETLLYIADIRMYQDKQRHYS